MNKDLKQGFVIGGLFSALVACAVITSDAEAIEESRISDSQICEKSIKYSMKYMAEEDASILHQARWNILKGDTADDIQKMVGLTMFEMSQNTAYNFPNGEVEEVGKDVWWKEYIIYLNTSCEELIEGLRGTYGYGDDIDSANPDEAW